MCVCVYVYRGNEMAFERGDKSIVKHVSIIYIIHRFPADNLSPAVVKKEISEIDSKRTTRQRLLDRYDHNGTISVNLFPIFREDRFDHFASR